jgi:serine protease Do
MSSMKANGKWLAAVACSVLVAGAAIGWAEVQNAGQPRVVANDVRQLSSVFRDVAKRSRAAIVTIETTGKQVRLDRGDNLPFDLDQGPLREFFKNQPDLRERFNRQREHQDYVPHGMGSGFVIDPQGVILTNSHVVKDAQDVTVRFADGRKVHATDIKSDPRTDIAIVRIKPQDVGTLEAVPMGNSDQMEVGDWVLAIGSPFGLDMTVTAGIVSAKGRGIQKTSREDYIQTDAAINPGNSGGPLLNLNGEVIGINTAISTRSGGYDGIGFAIPINMAHWVADQLMTKGEVKRAYIGVGIKAVEGTLARVLNVPSGEGAIVTMVGPNSPAEKAGLKSHDVILDFNGHKVSGPTELQGIVERLTVGKTYDMTVVRDGKHLTLPVLVREMPKDYSLAMRDSGEENGETKETPSEASKFDDLGIEIRPLTAEAVKSLRTKDVKGVVISTVKPGSLAEEAGMREGMVIERVNNQAVATPEQFKAAIKSGSLLKGFLFDVRTYRGTEVLAIRKG